MSNSNSLNDYINGHPRECLFFLVISLSLAWQSIASILGLVIYVVFGRINRKSPWLLLFLGLITSLIAMYFQMDNSFSFIGFIHRGFHNNFIFWKIIFEYKINKAFVFLFTENFIYLTGFPLFLAGIVGFIGLIANNPHEKIMKSLKDGNHFDEEIEIKEKVLNKKLKILREEDYKGTVLGVSKYTGQYVVVPDRDINQVALVLGTTGSGKTITLRRFYQRAILKGYPLIIVDGKPDDENIKWLSNLAQKYGRNFFGFNCGNKCHYDPLKNGGFTELKDKIICLKDEWENDYYRSIAEDYLQTTLEVLLKLNLDIDFKLIIDCLTYKNLVALTKSTKCELLMKRVASLNNYEMKDIRGLQAHLNILINSELGSYFEKNPSALALSLSDVIEKNGVVYFALPALRFPSFSKVLGKLVINDIKTVIDRRNYNDKPIFTVFDEFSIFVGDQVLNLVNMGRGKGIHAIFGTQGLADLDHVDGTFKSQILNCVNTLICHRLNDQDSSEAVSNWIGTKHSFNITVQLDANKNESGMGTVKRNKEFIVHPDEIKQNLKIGEAFYVTKVEKFKWNKIKIKFL